MAATRHDDALSGARIGPNAVIQTAAALHAALGDRECRTIFDDAALAHYLASPPQAMVDEREVARLHRGIRARYPATTAGQILHESGRLTGEYVLAHRIPAPVRRLLGWLPAPVAAAALLGAIRRHAWTFIGSGEFRTLHGPPIVLEIRGNPLVAGETAAGPLCEWHAAVFETLFRRLVAGGCAVRETHCMAAGDDLCRFVVEC